MNDMCRIIAEYETAASMEESQRCTEYVSQHKSYMFKLNADRDVVNQRYREALKEAKEQGQSMKIVLKIVMEHNLTDQAYYSVENIQEALNAFEQEQSPEKLLGIQVGECDIFILRQISGRDLPEIVSLETDLLQRDLRQRFENQELHKLEQIRAKCLNLLLKRQKQIFQEKTRQLMEQSESCFARKQEKINYKKEIRKKMVSRDKVFIDAWMEGYDFREMVLEHAIFINCGLARANFSGVMLENAIFLNCDLTDAIFAGAAVNHAYLYQCGEGEKIVDSYMEEMRGDIYV